MRLSASTCHVISNRPIFHYNPVHKLRDLENSNFGGYIHEIK